MAKNINVQELKDHAPLIPYVERFYKDKIVFEKESGNAKFAKCIFHDENTASLAFFNTNTYKCFGCGEYGDIINLVEHMENVSFEEACKIIADNVGYALPMVEEDPEYTEHVERMTQHAIRYVNNLKSNEEARQYLMEQRGLSQAILNQFAIGVTDKDEYKFRTAKRDISNKISFPILEHRRSKPRCVGMGYRGLTNEEPRYSNDSGYDDIFIKGNYLYGYPNAYESIKRSEYAIIVEGYIDVLAMHQAGITNTIGTMGIALNEVQTKKIADLTKNVVLMYDGDKAGIDADIRAIKLLLKEELNIVVCILDNCMDPADMCLKNNFDNKKIVNIINQHTKHSIDFMLNRILADYENIVIQEKINTIRNAQPILDIIKDESTKAVFQSELNRRLGL